MSLQHVFESARRLGLPVMVTDVGGRDPMVVLPLEQFEAMAGETSVRPKAVTSHQAPKAKSHAASDLDPADLDALSGLGSVGADLPLDERFYLEPVEDPASGS